MLQLTGSAVGPALILIPLNINFISILVFEEGLRHRPFHINMTKKFTIIIVLQGMLLLEQCSENKYEPKVYLSPFQQQSLIWSVIRYSAKLPPMATSETKFDRAFDSYYASVAEDYDIRAYYVDEDSTHYFIMTKPARSITPMREAVGCRVKKKNDAIVAYEEIFRTWKMPDQQLNERFPVLFEKMVSGESLEPYYPKNAGDQYIEFPDGRFYFDKAQRMWRDRLMDSLKVIRP